jgi:hypothetical protein
MLLPTGGRGDIRLFHPVPALDLRAAIPPPRALYIQKIPGGSGFGKFANAMADGQHAYLEVLLPDDTAGVGCYLAQLRLLPAVSRLITAGEGHAHSV